MHPWNSKYKLWLFGILGILIVSLPTNGKTMKQLSRAPMDATNVGLALQEDIKAEYSRLRQQHALNGSLEGNDITAVVTRHIPLGTQFDTAESVLRAAGLTVSPRPSADKPRGSADPHDVFASSLTIATDGMTYPNVEVRITLTPDAPETYAAVRAIHARIFIRGL